ncbi:MAG: LysR family transcriptional regulator [Desulfobacterales bacterium]|nr:LysR family transcriptional regulator [Desulfobacterales bacterium]
MSPDFNRLKVFYHIHRNKSVAAAARDLHVTQSAVSQHLRKLETEVKTRLFTRLPGRLAPTPAGEKLFQTLEPFIADLENWLKETDHARKGPAGMLRTGAPVEFGEKYLPPAFASFRQSWPEVSFQLELGHPATLLPLVREGRLDFAFADIFSDKGAYSRDLAVFSVQRMIDEELVLLCSKSYYNQFINHDHSPGRLLACAYISYQESAPAIKSWFRHHYNKTSVHPRVALAVESVRAVLAGIKQGMGLGVVPSHFIRDEIADGRLIQITTDQKEMTNRISLVQLQDKIPGLAEKTFLSFFIKKFPGFRATDEK